MDLHEKIVESMNQIPKEVLERADRTLDKLAEMGKNMTGKDRLEQKRYNLYGSPNPDSKTKARVDKYMRDYYNC